MPRLFSFPEHVNEVSARLVAAGVVAMSLATILLDQPWILLVIAYGFVARVLAGPSLSPLALVVTRVITPRIPVEGRLVPGPPKRFAQAIGAVMSVSAALLALGFGQEGVAYALIGLLAVAAGLEAAFALCIGCHLFAGLMRAGVIPKDVCVRCTDMWGGARAGA